MSRVIKIQLVFCQQAVNLWLNRYKFKVIKVCKSKKEAAEPTILSNTDDLEVAKKTIRKLRQRKSFAKAELELRLG